jgi:hypothetical protein
MSINVKSLSKDERRKLIEEIQKAEQEEKEAYKKEFVNAVVETAIQRGVKWSEALALLNAYSPDNDTIARKLGYKYKAKNKDNKTTYYMRKMSDTKEF